MQIHMSPLLTLVPLLGNAAFFGGVAAGAAALVAAIVFGVSRFQTTVGKFVAIVAGVMLLALLAFVVFVLSVAESAQHGAPL